MDQTYIIMPRIARKFTPDVSPVKLTIMPKLQARQNLALLVQVNGFCLQTQAKPCVPFIRIRQCIKNHVFVIVRRGDKKLLYYQSLRLRTSTEAPVLIQSPEASRLEPTPKRCNPNYWYRGEAKPENISPQSRNPKP